MARRARSWARPAAIAASAAAHVAAVLALAAHQPSLGFAPQRVVNVQLIAPPTPVLAPGPEPKKRPAREKPRPAAPPKSTQTPAQAPTSPSPAATPGDDGAMRVTPAAISRTPSAVEPAVAQPTASAAAEDPLVVFRRQVWARLAAHPPAARAGSGVCRVAFGLDRMGGVRFARLERSSGRPEFDRACLASVRAAAPYPEAPDAAGPPDLAFEVPIRAARP